MDFDCDDTDPDRTWARYIQLYLDQDGDGYGDELERVADHAPKHVISGNDCDDSNRELSPYQEELALDGVDSDCDGDDAPLLLCNESTDIAVPAGASCEGVGLAILARSECQGRCGGGTGVVSIVNLGSEASPAARLRITREYLASEDLEIPALEPGEVYVTPELQLYAEMMIELPTGTSSCAPALSTRTHLNGNYNAC